MKNITICHKILQTIPDEENFGNLILGGVGSLKLDIIEHFRITTVLTVMDSYMYEKLKIKQKTEKAKINHHKWIEIQDDQDEDIFPCFQPSHEFIDKFIEKNNVLVHCQAGISRSASVVISYLMKIKQMKFQDALKYVRSKRYQISPNQGFEKCLISYEEKISQSIKANSKEIQYNQESPFNNSEITTKYCQHIVCLNSKFEKSQGNLFLGSISAITKPHIIKNFEIKAVLTIIDERYYKMMKIKQKCEHNQIEDHLWIQMKDNESQNIQDYFQQSFQFITDNLSKGNVLVHCQAGVSRSASLVIAFMMRKFHMTLFNAQKYVKGKREQVKPNEGFKTKLKTFEKKFFTKV